MAPTNPCDLTATDQLVELEAGRLSARELLLAHFDRIDHVDPEVNAIIAVDRDSPTACSSHGSRRLMRWRSARPTPRVRRRIPHVQPGLVGRPHGDLDLLSVAAFLERERPSEARRVQLPPTGS